MSARALTAGEVAANLGFPPGSREARYVAELAGEPEEEGIEPLSPSRAAELLGQLNVSRPEAEDVLATLPDPTSAPEWWWCTSRAAGRLVRAMGEPDRPRGTWPDFEGPDHDLARRCHFSHVALLVAPYTLAYYRALGVGEETAWAALTDVSRHMAIHRQVFGLTGIDAAWWVTLCLRGEIVDLGRLQYNRFTLSVSDESPGWYPREEAERRGAGFRPGDPCLGIHIPVGAPLDPELVSHSLEEAGRFFPRYFPVPERRIATCASWLLDPQLAEYLPEGSNILSFQRRFELLPGHHDGDGDVLLFVFRKRGGTALDSLPQRTRMERSAVAHLSSGRHWHVRTGWLDLPS